MFFESFVIGQRFRKRKRLIEFGKEVKTIIILGMKLRSLRNIIMKF